MRTLLLVLAFVALVALALAWRAAATRDPAPEFAAAGPRASSTPHPALVVRPSRTEVAPPGVEPGDAFTSFDEAGERIAEPVRDGIVLWVCSTHGVPAADEPVTVHWRKGFGLYGKDVGRTDARGRLPTTVAEVEQFEGIEVADPKLGTLGYWGDLLPTAEDPRTVQLVVPDLATLRVRVVDGRGGPIPGGQVKATGGGVSALPRQHLLGGAPREASTDDGGGAQLVVAQGSYEVTAAAPDCILPQSVWADVGAAGGDATVVLLRDEHRIDVTVHVTPPPGHTAAVNVVAFTRSVLDRAGLPGRGGEGIYRELFVDRQGGRTFVVRADGLPWRCVVKSQGCADAVVDVPAGRTEVQVALAAGMAAPPKARLVVTVFDPEGNPTFADVQVYTTPDLDRGSESGTQEQGRLVLELEPQVRVCIGARRHGFASAMAGPIELHAGEQAVALRLLPSLVVSGRVVDAAGNGLPAHVVLHRPAGALRGLAEGLPEILGEAPTADGLDIVDGNFEFRDCGPGEHEVWVFPDGGELPAKKRVLPGAPITVVPGEGLTGLHVVLGIVRDAVTQAPVEGVQLNVATAVTYRSPRSDAGGHFRFVAPPGELQIRAVRRGYAVYMSPPSVVGDGPLVVDILLPPSPLRFLRVLDAAGRPVIDGEVAVLGAAGEPIDLLDEDGYYDGTSQSTDPAGRVDLRGAPGGRLRVRVTRGERQQVFEVPATGGLDAAFELRWSD